MMLRMSLTLAVGFALLVGVGAWFDPEGAREAIHKDLAGFAGDAAVKASDVVREAVEQAAASVATRSAAISRDEPVPTPKPAAGPRTGKKRQPIVAAAPILAGEPLEVEELQLDERAEFEEAPLDAEDETPRSVAELRSAPPDVSERGELIRRMLALYARVSQRK